MKIEWEENAAKEYRHWKHSDQRIVRRIDELIEDIEKHPLTGLGKPEELEGDLKGFYSRRIDEKDRLVYTMEGDTLVIASCKGHYSKEKDDVLQLDDLEHIPL